MNILGMDNKMSQPDKEWILRQIKIKLDEIDKFVSTDIPLTNSMREIIRHNTNEIELKIYELIRVIEKK